MSKKQPWTAEEVKALEAGVAKHGVGKWKEILNDLELGSKFLNRTNKHLKDKWRNMEVSQSKRGTDTDDVMTHKAKATPSSDHSSILDSAMKNNYSFQEYDAMIFEAISSLKDPRGSNFSAIADFIKQRYGVPHENFRNQLDSNMRKLVREEKLEQFYKIKDAAPGTDTPTPEQMDVRAMPMQTASHETVDSAAETAALRVAEAQNKALCASLAIKESERVSKLAEDAGAMLTLAKELFVQCELKEARRKS